MRGRVIAIVSALAIVIVVMGLLLWRATSVPKQDLVDSRFVPVPEILQGNENFAQVLQGLETHGNVPINVSPNDIGRTDPFAN